MSKKTLFWISFFVLSGVEASQFAYSNTEQPGQCPAQIEVQYEDKREDSNIQSSPLCTNPTLKD